MFYVINEILEMVAHVHDLDRIYKYRRAYIGSPIWRAIEAEKKNKSKNKKRKVKKRRKADPNIHIPKEVVNFLAGYAFSHFIEKEFGKPKDEGTLKNSIE